MAWESMVGSCAIAVVVREVEKDEDQDRMAGGVTLPIRQLPCVSKRGAERPIPGESNVVKRV